MTLPRGRVIRGAAEPARPDRSDATTLTVVPGAKRARPSSGVPWGQRLDREVVAAHERAAAIVAQARERARLVLADAERSAADIELRAQVTGRALGLAQVAGAALGLREREDAADAAALDRVVELARLLAERLLRRALALDPALIGELANGVLSEARGARRIELHAHPKDVPVLEAALVGFDPDGRVHAVVADPSLASGDLRLETDVGTVDARLGTGFERLAQRLREALAR